MLDYARFLDALGSEDGLEHVGVHLQPSIVAGLRGHQAYALAWFENWTRDGQPAGGTLPVEGAYPPSPDVTVSDFAAAGYARTGDDTAMPASPSPSPPLENPNVMGAPPTGRRAARRVAAAIDAEPLSTPEAPAPGWYPSPTGAGQERWWEGASWTSEHRPVLRRRRRGLARFLRR